MRYLLIVLSVLVLAASLRAAEENQANALTPKEIAEGWIVLFEGETTFGWETGGKPSAKGGVLLHGSEQDIRAATSTTFRLYELKLEYRIEKTRKGSAPVTWQTSYGPSELKDHKGEWVSATFEVKDGEIKGSANRERKQTDERADLETVTYHFFYETILRRSRSIPEKSDASPQQIAFRVPTGNTLALRNVKLKPKGMKPLLNGKDLKEWNQFPAKKSKFRLTEEGWLSIKDGPGDLQTVRQWDDFVLQLECKTNGDNLNSGVFFRCLPDQYQQGYEAQIQNQHAKKPKTYTIEEYDARTHKLSKTTKIENWSQDYGTGAIYRRIPARKAVAKDREWFTMTIAAHGRHLATWVNGIQVVDWTDNRPENENARQGCCLNKGPISLQGHDPTTDLFFRNIRIADLREQHRVLPEKRLHQPAKPRHND
jgi:hypothetical protein